LFLNVSDEDIFSFFVEGGMVTERSRVLQAFLCASADFSFVHIKGERELRSAELVTKNFHAPGVEKTQLMIPIYLAVKPDSRRRARMSRCQNSQASNHDVIPVTGSPGERCVIFQGVMFSEVSNFNYKRTSGLKFPGRIRSQTLVRMECDVYQQEKKEIII
jgi:hypothetical protein